MSRYKELLNETDLYSVIPDKVQRYFVPWKLRPVKKRSSWSIVPFVIIGKLYKGRFQCWLGRSRFINNKLNN